jgi:hypothetical protein
MANSTASISIKPTVAFNHGDTLFFCLGSAPQTVLNFSNAASP